VAHLTAEPLRQLSDDKLPSLIMDRDGEDAPERSSPSFGKSVVTRTLPATQAGRIRTMEITKSRFRIELGLAAFRYRKHDSAWSPMRDLVTLGSASAALIWPELLDYH
jgi:hypothetical protein